MSDPPDPLEPFPEFGERLSSPSALVVVRGVVVVVVVAVAVVFVLVDVAVRASSRAALAALRSAGVGASLSESSSLVTGSPTESRETTYDAYPMEVAPKRPRRARPRSVKAGRIETPFSL